ncbi:ComEC/Rec2 family competence protein [Ktedonospora formicarum]|uniref:Uncharacterized protein n=1 Tax=Ktedonospora formicarum TaxID=2778364 RepID=A0A8J3HY06_9CHLR|nr:hypothetical protein [Ktedonospora formicarum]GHO43185.1 hypothetical protein KSX_13480 [Ktedonospora formicarum]
MAQTLDSQLPLWQRTLDTVLLTTPRQDHITGLQDVVERYAIGRVIDAGMLHPTATYARWRRTISEHDIPYFAVQQGDSMELGSNLQLQVLWPTSLHKSSDEARDNCLVIRLIMPGLKLLLLSVAGASTYALQGILSSIQPSDLHADIVQVESAISKPYPSVLRTLFERAQPSILVVSPVGSRGSTQTAENNKLYFSTFDDLQIWSVADVGALAIRRTDQGWLTYTEENEALTRFQ